MKYMKTYRIRWTEHVGYFADVKAESAEEARDIWNAAPWDDGLKPCGFCEIDADSIEVAEAPEENG